MLNLQRQLGPSGSGQESACRKLRHGSLFTGVGGIDLGLEWMGFETVFQVEKDPFATRVLKKQWPKVKRFDNVTKCGRHNLEPVDIISGGFPCQQISFAGKREGIGTAERPTKRSGLWFEFRRIVAELRPRWVLIENVPGLKNLGADDVLSAMEALGYACWPFVVGAGNLGAPHERKRIWILCRRNDDHIPVRSEWTGTQECQQKMRQAKERWDCLKRELAGPANEYSPMAPTPTATMVIEPDWPANGRFFRQRSGRMRKRCKSGSVRGMNWQQELLYRSVEQNNKRLLPTPELCEDFMGVPRGWTDLGATGPKDAAYAGALQETRGPRFHQKRLMALGNSAVPLIPMLLGEFIQLCESRAADVRDSSKRADGTLPACVVSHAGIQEFKEDRMSENVSVHGMPAPQIGENISPVDAGSRMRSPVLLKAC